MATTRKREWLESSIAFLLGGIPRLGKDSLVLPCTPYLRRDIVELNRPVCDLVWDIAPLSSYGVLWEFSNDSLSAHKVDRKHIITIIRSSGLCVNEAHSHRIRIDEIPHLLDSRADGIGLVPENFDWEWNALNRSAIRIAPEGFVQVYGEAFHFSTRGKLLNYSTAQEYTFWIDPQRCVRVGDGTGTEVEVAWPFDQNHVYVAAAFRAVGASITLVQ